MSHTLPVPTQAKQFSNTKINNELQIGPRTQYANQRIHIPFSEVVKYSTNNALMFFVGANVLSTYYINKKFSDNNNSGEKYMYIAASLFLIQIIYNYLDINDDTNLSRLQAMEQHQ